VRDAAFAVRASTGGAAVIVPVWSALAALLVGGVVGGLVLARSGLGWGPAEVTVRGLLGVSLAAAFTVHLALGAAIAIATFWLTSRAAAASREDPVPPLPRLALGANALVTAVAALRPTVPLFWDESVWLTKARVACEGPFELMARAVDPASDLVPRGYPIVAAVLEASFALGDPSLSALVGGGAALVILSFALFALLLARGPSPRDHVATLFVLAVTPLAWVHLRSVQLDLPVGLLTAALFLAIERSGKGDPIGLPAAITAALLLGIKDEGLASTIAVAAAVLSTEARASPAGRTAWLAAGALALSSATYRLELWFAGSTNDDHSLGEVSMVAIPDLARETFRHAVDLQTWGVVPPLALAAVVLALRRAAPTRVRTAALAIVFTASALGLALLIGPSQVRDFALEGTLLNRLGLELLPLAAILIPRVFLSDPPPALSGGELRSSA
jgi:hypothetical protein